MLLDGLAQELLGALAIAREAQLEACEGQQLVRLMGHLLGGQAIVRSGLVGHHAVHAAKHCAAIPGGPSVCTLPASWV